MSAPTLPRLEHVLAASQFDRDMVDALLERAARLEGVRDTALAGKIMASLFFEPSTRTRLSFESAMVRRGGAVIGAQDAAQTSSAAKGETLEDTVRVVAGYADLIVLRHPAEGAVRLAAAVSPVPVVNAGDGSGEHPTQALLDLYTIKRELGGLDGRRIVICGDLRYGRTVHSLAALASHYGMRFSLIANPGLEMPAEVVAALRARGCEVDESSNAGEAIRECDVLYQTRVQRERIKDGGGRPGVVVDAALMKLLPPHAIVMAPLPRVGEITPEVDNDPRAAYFRQAANGVTVRMALLEALLG
jgi:aspartate carbamoyltransferase catalytic subunit